MVHRLRRFFIGLFVFCLTAGGLCVSLGGCTGAEEGRQLTVFSGSSAAPGRTVADLADYRIPYYEADAEAAARAAAEIAGGEIAENDEPFRMADYGPRGELPQEIRKPAIYVVFSQPVVPLAKLGDPIRSADGEALFTVDPPLEGVYRWYGSRLLSFESDGERLPQRRYTVTLSESLRSLGGKALEGERSFSFETERLSVLSWSLGDGTDFVNTGNAPPQDARFITLIFSSPVNLEEIRRWLEVRGGGKTWPFRLSRPIRLNGRLFPEESSPGTDPEQGVLITLEETLPADTGAEVALLAGARSEPDWLGSTEERLFTFHTLLPFSFYNIWVRSASSPMTREDSIPINLTFSQPVESEGAPGCFSVEGLPPLKEENLRVYGTTVVLTGLPLEYRRTYQIRIAASLKDRWGRALGEAVTVRAEVGDASGYVFTKNSGPRMLEGAFPPRVAWEARNPLSIRFRALPAAGPYERPDSASLEVLDLSKLPGGGPAFPNARRFFIEDLTDLLGPGGRGSVGLSWAYELPARRGMRNQGSHWLTVQVTDLGITVRYAYNKVLVWVTRLSTGEAVPGARVELLEGAVPVREALADQRGLGAFEFPDGEFAARFSAPSVFAQADGTVGQGLRIRVSEGGGARAGGDQAEFIPNDSHNLWRFDLAAAASPFTVEQARPLIFLFTDRGLYRPGETVTFRGIDRSLNRGRFEVYQGPYTVEAGTGGYRAPVIASFEGVTTKNGGSYGSFTLPEDLAPGTYSLRYRRGEAAQSVSFTVANFERARFALSLNIPDIPFYAGENLSARLSASYLAGGALSGAPYTWYWSRENAAFNPGGDWQYWRFGPELGDSRSVVSQGEGTLGGDGTAGISQAALTEGIEGAPYRYRLEAAVQDAARQELAVRETVMVHPAAFYIAARLDSSGSSENSTSEKSSSQKPAGPSAWFLSAGNPAAVSWALLTPEGEAYQGGGAGELSYQAVRYEWKQARQAAVGGRVNLFWERVEVVEESGVLPLAGASPAGTIDFTPRQGGQWEIRLLSRDSRNRPAVTRFGFYVSGAGWVHWGNDDVDRIALTADRDRYAPGDTARLLVRSPLPRGKYLLTLEREGIFSERIIELDGSARTIEIPLDESHLPIVYAVLSSYTVRSQPPQNSYYEPDLDKPKGVFGLAALRVDHESRHYRVEIENSRGVYRPGSEAEVRLRVTLQGRPVPGAELSFLAVDRGVVDLIDYHVPDPQAYFYDPRNFPLAVRGADSRSLLIDPVTYTFADLQGGDAADDAKLEERKDFRPTAVFEPYLVTGPDGTATFRFRLPDSLTTYRCTALAVGLREFGIAEEDLRVSAPLTAVAALPRKLRWRDTGQASLILTNLEREAVEAEVSLELEGDALEVDGESRKTLTIPPGAAAEAAFRLAAVETGTARLNFTLRSPQVNERILRTLTVDRPAVYETVTLMGNLGDDQGFVEEGVIIPQAISEGTGTLSASFSASRLAMLKEAVGYLLDYPYGCLEQRTARLLPLVSFADHLEAFGLESSVEDPKGLIEKELAEIARSQLGDGSFPYWPGGARGHYYVTLRVAHIAALAREKGYEFPPLETGKLLSYLISSDEGRRIAGEDPFLRGYSLWVRAMYGERIGGELSAFLSQGDQPGISGWAFAGLAALELGMRDFALSTRDRIRRFIRPGTRTVDLTDTYEAGSFWGSATDRYALALMLYQALSPGDDMTSRLATTLIESRRRTGSAAGAWANTSACYWAILALGETADREAEAAPNLSARLSLGGATLLSADFAFYGGSPVSRIFPLGGELLKGLRRDALLPLRVEREGRGRLFYTASLRYGIPAELARPRDEGLGVFAETFDAEGRPVRDGRLLPGKTYTRRVVVSASRRRTFLALRVPVPSGAEILDAALVTTATTPPPEEENGDRESGNGSGRGPLYAGRPIQSILDDEVRFTWDAFPPGKAEVEFRFRAVMPGVYPTPPPQAECMYEEEVFGRGAGELVRIGT
ncbi:MAG: alpha-2-macroglobulin [Spirochaetaceae bacterium]|jgi:uncharacterized protein YfaS (alpha-2-macroglobulin family)|nr:alpha-2-macroglobulin [Spirochaetaceae bacterium]